MSHLRIYSDEFGKTEPSQPISRSTRPFSELLESICGSFLPGKLPSTEISGLEADPLHAREEDVLSANSLFVDHLNAAALQRLGALTFVWVGDVDAHLAFDVLQKTVKLYRLPSLCRIVFRSPPLNLRGLRPCLTSSDFVVTH